MLSAQTGRSRGNGPFCIAGTDRCLLWGGVEGLGAQASCLLLGGVRVSRAT